MPSRSMNAPKSVMFLTVPMTLSPVLTLPRNFWRFSRALLLDDFATAEDDVFALLVDLDDLEIVGVRDELLEILWRDDVDLRGGKEGFHTDVDREAALDDCLHLALDQAAVLVNADDLLPVLTCRGLFLGKDDHALVVFEALEEHFDLVADFDFRGSSNSLAEITPSLLYPMSTRNSLGRTSRMCPLTMLPSR